MKICIVAGARPNFIKVAPLIRAIRTAHASGCHIKENLVYTGSDSDIAVEPALFDELDIHRPDCCLGVTCTNLNELTGQVMSAFETYLRQHPADTVVVVDDLASTMAVAIVTKKQGIRLAHLAAGTRSFDINMPKEINRLVIDGLSDILFTAGLSNNSIANREGAELSKVYMVGNILIDNLRYLHNKMHRPKLMDALRLKEGEYLVLTLNRKALLAREDNLIEMITAIDRCAGGMPIIAPLHHEVRKVVETCTARTGNQTYHLKLTDPMEYLDFGYLTAHARGVISDSGNVAEEATFNQVACITLNSYTEHIETVKVGTNVLVGEDPERLAEAVKQMVAGQWKDAAIPERWDGRSAERIVSILSDEDVSL